MKYVVSVSKKGKNVWKIYYYDYNDDDDMVFQSKRINVLLVPFYKLLKCHRTKMLCDECNQIFLSVTRRKNPKYDNCPYCFN